MNIAFFTEMGFSGKIPRNHPNMRTEFAWMCALDAWHHGLHANYNVNKNPEIGIGDKYDLGIVIIPKKNPNVSLNEVRDHCKKVAVMQEGPNWYWQDYDLANQIHYINTLSAADIVFVHNADDVEYYSGLLNKDNVTTMPSLMIEESLVGLAQMDENPERENVMIGGNMTSWYGGFDSMLIAQEFGCQIMAPSMGRKIALEEELDIEHLPYMEWTQWMHSLNHKIKYGVHLMRTHAAGTFALNCAYLGIPCIGYNGLDTQEILHGNTTVDVGDLRSARYLAKRLRDDEEFYQLQSAQCKLMYNKFYTEERFKINFAQKMQEL